MMNHDRIHEPPLMVHMLIDGLNRYDERPCLFIGDAVLSYAEVRATASRMHQALKAMGLGVGSRVAILSGNRPEVLTNLAFFHHGNRGLPG